MKRLYIAAYHQSKFGKLMGMTVPEIVKGAVEGACGAPCNFSLNEQGLLAGLVASVPGLEGKPIEAVENACASGGQAIVSVAPKLLLGGGEIGTALGRA